MGIAINLIHNMIIDQIKNHNFDNGNFIFSDGEEMSFDGDNFKLELYNEVLTYQNLEEYREYLRNKK